MPKKSSTTVAMQDHPALSSRRWHTLSVLAVHKQGRVLIRFEFGVLDDVRQAGRIVVRDLPAVLTPNSPLCRFLADAFGVRLSKQQSFDLAVLVGRHLQARFDKGIDGCFQAMVDVRSCKGVSAQTEQAEKVAAKQEQTDGLG